MYPERVMGIIPWLSSGFMGQRSYSLVVTNYRLILAEVTSGMLKEEQKRAIAQQQNSGFMGKVKASMGSHFNYHQRYFNMPPQAILQEGPRNYEIRPDQVRSVKIRTGHNDMEYGGQYPHKMVIKWTGGKEKFTFDRMDPNQVKNILGPLLGPKVK